MRPTRTREEQWLRVRPFVACLAAIFQAVWALGQEAEPRPKISISAPSTASEPPQVVHRDPQFEALPPGVRLAVRVESLRRQVPVIPDLVLVPDASSFVLAMSAWRREYRFPVLIDDGSWRAKEDIARFARAFKPRSIVSWTKANVPGGGAPDWPADEATRRGAIEACLLRAWGGGPDQMDSAMKSLVKAVGVFGIDPPGVVVADAMDPSWPAALALAIGHAQPIIWYSRPPEWAKTNANNSFSQDALEPLEKQIEAGCVLLGLEWEGLGKGVDAITLCGNLPVRVQMNGILAVSDVLGRTEPLSKEKGRWAWCGQMWGETEARSAYRAMGSLFLQPTAAWMFDGYSPGPPWDEYDMTGGSEALRARGLATVIDDIGGVAVGSVEQWRSRASKALDMGLAMLNSRGGATYFALEPGIGRPADTPFLNVPCVTYVVHSFSAQQPVDRESVAGRWLERGAYLYFGSVEEPYLQSFIPTKVLTARLAVPLVFAAAVRPDDGAAWKHAVLGDPLTCLGPAAARSEGSLPFDKIDLLRESLAGALKGDELAEAFGLLLVLGRDEDAAKLAGSLWLNKDKRLTPAVAKLAMGPVFRTLRHEEPLTRAGLLARLFGVMTPADQRDGEMQDLLWLAANAELARTKDDVLVQTLREFMRPDNPALDAIALAGPVARLHGIDSARAVLMDAQARARDEHDTRDLNEAMDRLRGR